MHRYWWHEVTAVPTSDAASPSEAGDARPSCGLTASINYFFTPYYRKLSGECLPTGSLRWHGCARGWLPSPQVPRTFACAQTCAPLRTSRCTTSCAAHQMRGAQPGLTVGERPRQLVAKSCERRVCAAARLLPKSKKGRAFTVRSHFIFTLYYTSRTQPCPSASLAPPPRGRAAARAAWRCALTPQYSDPPHPPRPCPSLFRVLSVVPTRGSHSARAQQTSLVTRVVSFSKLTH